MSIIELIEQLCPNGVEYSELGELVRILDNQRRPVSKDKRIGGEYPYYGANGIQDYVDDYIFDGTYLLMGEDGSVINKDGSPILNWTIGKFWVNNHAHILSEIANVANLRFIYFYLQTIDVTPIVRGTPPKINQRNLRSISVPLPPLPIQKEIVTILDQFTQLQAELEAELQARRAQYEYYRNELMNFKGKEVEWKMLGVIGEFTRGKRFVKNDIVAEGVPCIHYGEMYTHYNIWARESKSFLEQALAAKLRVAHPGDVIIVAAGETVEDIGMGVAWLGESDVVIHDACFAFSHKLDPKYVSHYLQTELFHSQIKKSISSGKISSINASGLSKALIPIPSIEVQQEIVRILDKFKMLLNDPSVGLPAEIEARHKQYEYYRGKLLDFKPLSNG